jgi:serine/arginine repetitive matrix protein 1
MMQINLTGFLGGSKARLFIGELWKLLASAQTSPDGIPLELVEMKKKELLKRQEEDDRLREIRKREEDSHRQDIKSDIEKIDSKSNGRNQMSTSRNENGNTGGYKSRTSYEDNRRRPIEKDRREPKPR